MFFCFPGLRWFHKAQKGMPVHNHFTPDIPGTELLPYPAFLQLSAGKAATKMFVTESCWCWARNWRCSATQESALWHRGGGIKAFLCSHSTAGRSTDRYLPAQSSRMTMHVCSSVKERESSFQQSKAAGGWEGICATGSCSQWCYSGTNSSCATTGTWQSPPREVCSCSPRLEPNASSSRGGNVCHCHCPEGHKHARDTGQCHPPINLLVICYAWLDVRALTRGCSF